MKFERINHVCGRLNCDKMVQFDFSYVSYILPVILMLLFYYYFTKNNKYWQERGVACEEPTFLVGNVSRLITGKQQMGKFFGEEYLKYTQPYFGLYILHKPYLVLRSPALIKNILIRDFNYFGDRALARDEKADKFAARSVAFLPHSDWRSLRTKLTPIFTSGKLKLMFPIMKTVGESMENYLLKHLNETIEMKEVWAKFAMDITISTIFGVEINSFGNEESAFRKCARQLFELNFVKSFRMLCYFLFPSLVSLFRINFLDPGCVNFLEKQYIEILKYREKSNFKRNDFVDLLLALKNEKWADGKEFDINTIVAQAITFTAGGFETTSNTVAFVVYELSLHPEIQNRLREEIFSCSRVNEDLTYEQVMGMKFLDKVVAETLRMYPFTPFLTRKCVQNYLVEDTGLVIEKGVTLLVPTDGIHYDPEFYPEPHVFNPDRFQPDVKASLNACTYLPFGGGPRNCIGDRFALMITKVGLAQLLKKFIIEPCEKTPIPVKFNLKSPFATSTTGLYLKIRKVSETT